MKEPRVTIKLNQGIPKRIKQAALDADVPANEIYSQAVEHFLSLLQAGKIKIRKPEKTS